MKVARGPALAGGAFLLGGLLLVLLVDGHAGLLGIPSAALGAVLTVLAFRRGGMAPTAGGDWGDAGDLGGDGGD